jgi:hypothetical protein
MAGNNWTPCSAKSGSRTSACTVSRVTTWVCTEPSRRQSGIQLPICGRDHPSTEWEKNASAREISAAEEEVLARQESQDLEEGWVGEKPQAVVFGQTPLTVHRAWRYIRVDRKWSSLRVLRATLRRSPAIAIVRPSSTMRFRKRITLNAGPNIVRVGAINSGGTTAFCARFLNQNDKPLKGFTVSVVEAAK